MKSRELRIGNLVMNTKGQIIEVKSIFNEGIHDENFNGHKYNDLEYIALTEDFVSSLGFFRNGQTEQENKIWTLDKSDGNFSILQIENEFYLEVEEFGNEIQSVHKLQNIVHSLFDEELIYNEN